MTVELYTKLIVVLALLLMVFVGHSMSYEDELNEQALYCKMVAEGTWPDYNGNADKVCK